MNPAESLQIDMQAMRQKNESFFKEKEPAIYNMIADKKFSESDLQIMSNTATLELDVIEKGGSRYFGRSKYYCQEEANKFLEQMSPGTPLPNFITTDSSIYSFNRLGSRDFRLLSDTICKEIDPYNTIPLPDFIPLLVITGIGTGFHIENILKERKISSLVIYERSLDRFLTSLYCIDWSLIFSHFNTDEGSSIQLIIANSSDPILLKGVLWNELIQYCPHFPFTTLFYNHLSDNINEDIINHIKDQIVTFLQQWGHYDDEINQYNNARQNFRLGAKSFTPSTFKVNPHIPVAIIGAGPSLDDKIEILKKYRDKLLIISCGTSIGTLYLNNIKPDFHIELESDHVVYEAISKVTDHKFRKGIKLLAAAQVNPLALNLFEENCVYFKDSTALAELYTTNKKDILTNCTPTCTNAGVAIATRLGFKNVFLFGTDFGFPSKDIHHAKGSIYYQDNDKISDTLKNSNDFKDKKTITIKSVRGTNIETKPLYFVAQRAVEECIKYSHKVGIKVFNCADGASIRNTNWLNNDALDKKLDSLNVAADPKELCQAIFDHSKEFPNIEIDERSKVLLEFTNNIFDTLIRRKCESPSMEDISKNIFRINNIISRQTFPKMGYLYFFVRGQIWLYLSMYYTFSLACKNDKEREFVIQSCEDWLISHKEKITTEMKKILFHELSIEEDPWVNSTVEVINDQPA